MSNTSVFRHEVLIISEAVVKHLVVVGGGLGIWWQTDP